MACYVLRHPTSLVPIVRAAWRLRRDGWWRQSPFLPVPGESYWAFRLQTAFGVSGEAPKPADVVAAAKWSVAPSTSR